MLKFIGVRRLVAALVFATSMLSSVEVLADEARFGEVVDAVGTPVIAPVGEPDVPDGEDCPCLCACACLGAVSATVVHPPNNVATERSPQIPISLGTEGVSSDPRAPRIPPPRA